MARSLGREGERRLRAKSRPRTRATFPSKAGAGTLNAMLAMAPAV